MATRTPDHAFDIAGSPAFKLVKLANLVTQEFEREIAAQLDISVVEWRVIAALHRCEQVTAAEVTRITGHNAMVISRAVNRLVDEERVSRAKDDDDNRRLLLRLTTKGQDIFERISPMALRVEASLFGDIPPQDLLAVDRFLGRGLDTLGQRPGSRPRREP